MDFGGLVPIAGILGGTVMFVSALRSVQTRQALEAASGQREELASENAARRAITLGAGPDREGKR